MKNCKVKSDILLDQWLNARIIANLITRAIMIKKCENQIQFKWLFISEKNTTIS